MAPLSAPLPVTWSVPEDPVLRQRAIKSAAELDCPCLPITQAGEQALCWTAQGLELRHGQGRLQVDFLAPALRYRLQHGGGIRQPLARAAGLKPGRRPLIADATAGLGIDGFILASLGCRVVLLERSPSLAALLRDGLARAADDPELGAIISRMQLISGDSCRLLSQLDVPPETVYLDPMYPGHGSKSALNRQSLRLIRLLVGDDPDSDALLTAALATASERVVVKRPKGAPLVAGRKPSHEITMKNSRYDVYLIR